MPNYSAHSSLGLQHDSRSRIQSIASYTDSAAHHCEAYWSDSASFAPVRVKLCSPKRVSSLALLLIVADITVLVGLWRLRAWARIGAVVLLLIALAFAFSAFHAAFVTRGSFALMYLEQFIGGVVFAMMFLPPLSLEFARKRPNHAMQRTAGRSDV